MEYNNSSFFFSGNCVMKCGQTGNCDDVRLPKNDSKLEKLEQTITCLISAVNQYIKLHIPEKKIYIKKLDLATK